jgi:oxygen-independent coproporphyrinogen III oxidase
MSAFQVDLDLVRKYNQPGPRYTSYPPATRFTDQVQWSDLGRELVRNNESLRDLSLYFHLPFCQSLCWYCGCTTVITTQSNQADLYLDILEKELAQMGRILNPERQAVQLHFGGGTPTFLSPAQLARLGKMIHASFSLANEAEAGVEIDPRWLERAHITTLREIGFNRASVGVQDFDPKVQVAVHRVQPFEQTFRVIDWIRQEGFESVNIDLIYGLPYQTPESFEKTLDQALEMDPDRLAVFSYAHVPWLKPAQKILQNSLPSPELKLQMLKLTVEKLTADNRYVYIGMDHFARPTDELALAQKNKTLRRNFQGYSTKGGTDIYGFGMSSISQTENLYWQNHKDLEAYSSALARKRSPIAKACFLTREDCIRRETIMRLMCDLSLDYALLSGELGINFEEHFGPELAGMDDLEADGLVTRGERSLEVTPNGRLFIRNIAMRFDAYLPREQERRFSKTI